MKLWSKGIVSAVALCGLCRCAVGPDYVAPTRELPASFAGSTPSMTADPTLPVWWVSFNDGMLTNLVAEAIEGNYSIDAALARVNQSRALRQLSFYDLVPTITTQGGFTRSKDSTARIPAVGSIDLTHEFYSASADASWEIDLFGRVRRQNEQRRAEEQGSQAALDDALRLVIADVATNYFTLRGAQASLEVARENVRSQEETVALIRAQAAGGVVSELDVARASTQLKSTQAIIPPLESAIKVAMHRLAVLTGRNPAELEPVLQVAAKLPRYDGPVALGDPAALLRRRPDVRIAERALAAATAGIGVAEGDYFPKVTFIGSLGFEASTPSRFGEDGTDMYLLSPRISWPALDMGRVIARVHAADARAQEALALYQQTVLAALEEVENSLVRFAKERERRDLLKEAALQSDKATELARIRYKEGGADFLTVLDAQRAQLAAEAQLSESETQLAINLVGIYKALGGGWEGAELSTKK